MKQIEPKIDAFVKKFNYKLARTKGVDTSDDVMKMLKFMCENGFVLVKVNETMFHYDAYYPCDYYFLHPDFERTFHIEERHLKGEKVFKLRNDPKFVVPTLQNKFKKDWKIK